MVKSFDAFKSGREILENAGIEKAAYEAGLLFKHVCGKSRLEIDEISPQQQAGYEKLCTRRAKHEPLQYILGSWAFMNLELKVGEGVLIPRSETEELCVAAGKALENNPDAVIYDLCAGSGAIALALQSMLPQAKITAVEKSEKAFKYLEENIAYNSKAGAKSPMPVLADVLAYYSCIAQKSADLIISNPPYVTPNEYKNLSQELYYEPKMALVPPEGNDGMFFYEFIAQNYKPCLKKGGYLFFETGAEQGMQLYNILSKAGYVNIKVIKDMNGKDRIVRASA